MVDVPLVRPQAVLFDIGNTVLEERRFDLEAGIGAVVTDRAHAETLAGEFRAQMIECHREGREPLLAQWLVDRVPSLAPTALAALEDAIWNAVVTLAPTPGVERVFERLSNDGIAIAAVSNAAFSGRVLRSELARHGLADRLRFVLSSADIGSRKPAVAMFETAIARLGVPAHQTWFVGDTVDEDVAGARAAGLQPILFSYRTGSHRHDPRVASVNDWAEFMILYSSARVGDGSR